MRQWYDTIIQYNDTITADQVVLLIFFNYCDINSHVGNHYLYVVKNLYYIVNTFFEPTVPLVMFYNIISMKFLGSLILIPV